MLRLDEILIATKGKMISRMRESCFKGLSIDSRKVEKGELFVALKGPHFDGHDFIPEAVKRGAIGIVIEREGSLNKNYGDRLNIIKVNNSVRALGKLAGYLRKKAGIPVIGVTGSNGKTTTKEMIAHVLARKFNVLSNEGTKNNQIGLPLTLLGIKDSHEAAVLEMGSNHFGEIAYLSKICRPNIGIITNINQSHTKYFGNLKGVLREKTSLINNLCSPYIALINNDDPMLSFSSSKISKNSFVLGVAINNKGDFRAGNARLINNSQVRFTVNGKYIFTLNTTGYYNIYNALLTIAVSRIMGISYEEISLSLNKFTFPKSRLQFLKINNSLFIDDTYNSNPASLKQALEVLRNIKISGRRIFVMGDMLELGPQGKTLHSESGKTLAESCDILITVGELSSYAAHSAERNGISPENIFICKDNIQARKLLYNKIIPGKRDVVLVKGSRSMAMEKVLNK